MIHPVQILHEQSRVLEAATTVVLANPRKGAVHKLRSSVRRVQAQLTLLEELSSMPDHAKEAQALQRTLRKAHQAAGEVRDLDVQSGLLSPRHRLPRPSAEQLIENLERKRQKRADQLRAVLIRLIPKLAASLEAMSKALAPAEKMSMDDTRLCRIITKWSRARISQSAEPADDERLHEIRKDAKTARYMAEIARASRQARDLAKRFEALQDLGGKWHDWLDLAKIARKRAGSHDELTKIVAARADAARAKFVSALR